MVRPAGLEPATPGLGNRCSILLSYGRTELNSSSARTRGATSSTVVSDAFRHRAPLEFAIQMLDEDGV